MIEAVGNYKDINITKLANVLGITRGGASQGIDKLCKKQMILKKPSPLTDNEVVLTLTERGNKAFYCRNEADIKSSIYSKKYIYCNR